MVVGARIFRIGIVLFAALLVGCVTDQGAAISKNGIPDEYYVITTGIVLSIRLSLPHEVQFSELTGDFWTCSYFITIMIDEESVDDEVKSHPMMRYKHELCVQSPDQLKVGDEMLQPGDRIEFEMPKPMFIGVLLPFGLFDSLRRIKILVPEPHEDESI